MKRLDCIFKIIFLGLAASILLSVPCFAEEWVPKPVSPIPTPLSSISSPNITITDPDLLAPPVRDESIALELARKYMLSTDYPEVIELKIVSPSSENYHYEKGKRSLFYHGTGVFSKTQQPVFVVSYCIDSKVNPWQTYFAVFQNTGFVKEISLSELDQVDTGRAANDTVADYLNLDKKNTLVIRNQNSDLAHHCKLISNRHLISYEGEYLIKDTQEFVFLVTHTEYTSETKDQVKTKEQYAVVKKTGKVKRITLDQLKPMPQKEQPQKNS